MYGEALAEQTLGGTAPDRRAQLLVDVQPLSGLPTVDHRVDIGHHRCHIALDVMVPQPRCHHTAAAPVVRAVADDQRGRPVDGNQALKRLAPAERVGIGEHESVGLCSQEIGVAMPTDSGVDQRTAPSIQRQQRFAKRVAHRPIRPHSSISESSSQRFSIAATWSCRTRSCWVSRVMPTWSDWSCSASSVCLAATRSARRAS